MLCRRPWILAIWHIKKLKLRTYQPVWSRHLLWQSWTWQSSLQCGRTRSTRRRTLSSTLSFGNRRGTQRGSACHRRLSPLHSKYFPGPEDWHSLNLPSTLLSHWPSIRCNIPWLWLWSARRWRLGLGLFLRLQIVNWSFSRLFIIDRGLGWQTGPAMLGFRPSAFRP